MADDDISPTLKWRNTGCYAPEEARPLDISGMEIDGQIRCRKDRINANDARADDDKRAEMEEKVPRRLLQTIPGEEEGKEEKTHPTVNNKISIEASYGASAIHYLKELDEKEMDDFMNFQFEEKEFDGHLHSLKMFMKYKHWSLNGIVNMGALRGFERKGFYSVLRCDGCGWITDMFPSIQKRCIHRKHCWMCRVKAKQYGQETHDWYQGQLNSTFRKMEEATKDNRNWKHDYI